MNVFATLIEADWAERVGWTLLHRKNASGFLEVIEKEDSGADGTGQPVGPASARTRKIGLAKPRQLPSLGQAKDKRYYILHSPEDKVCPHRMAVSASEELRKNGAIVEFTEYPGGHGWRGNVFGNIRQGMDWLESNAE